MQPSRIDPGSSSLLDRLKQVENLLQSVGPVLTLQAVFPDADPFTPGYVVCTPNHLVGPATPLASNPCTLHVLHTQDLTRRPNSPPHGQHPTAPPLNPSYPPTPWTHAPWGTPDQTHAPLHAQRQQRELNLEEFLEELDNDVEEVAAGRTTRRHHTNTVPAKSSSFANKDAVLDLLRCVKPGLLAPVARRRDPSKSESGSARGGSPDTFTQIIRSRNLEDVTGSLLGAGWSHPNLAGVCMALWHAPSSAMYVVSEQLPLNLGDMLRFCKAALEDEHKVRFIVYQLLQGLQALHSQGYAHGGISLQSVLLSPQCWLKLQGPMTSLCHAPSLPQSPPFPGLHGIVERWRHRLISNFDYLLWLNYLAGRRWGDVSFHYILPWVLDLSALSHLTEPLQPSAFNQPNFPGWRDLSISKYRLCKGDVQLDFTYQSSESPHHISSEPLSELSYCIYHARCLPKTMLTRYVRAVFQPHEYPRSIQALYESTPDECIPEYYFEPGVFTSVHAEMGDLEVPAWAGTAENFVALHRAALESEHVSDHLHQWIDLMFGYKLSGSAAVEAKNVYLQHNDPAVLRSRGVFQLFSTPHPARKSYRQAPSTSRTPFAGALQDMENLLKSVSCTSESDPPLAQPPRPPVQAPQFPMPQHLAASSHHAAAAGLPPWPSIMHDPRRKLHGSWSQLNDNEDAMLKVPPPNGLAAGIPLAFDCVEDPSTETSLPNANGLSKEQEWIIPALRSSQQEHAMRSMGFCPEWSNEILRTQSWGQWNCEGLSSGGLSMQRMIQQDVQAVGRIMLQLYLKRPCFGPQDDSAYWFRLASRLPSCVRPFVLACLHGCMTAEELLHSTFFPPSMATAYECLSGVLFIPVYSTDSNSPLTAAEQQLMVCLDNLVVRVRSGQLDDLQQQPQVLELCLPHMLQLIHDCMKISLSQSSSQQTGLDVLGLLLAITKALTPKSALQHIPPLLAQVLSKDQFQGFDWRAVMCAPALQLQLLETMGLGPYVESVLPLLLSVILDATSTSSTSAKSSPPHRLTSATSQAAIAALTTVSSKMPFPVLKGCLLNPLLSVLQDSSDAALALVALAHVVGGPLCAQHLVPHLLPNLSLQKTTQDPHDVNHHANLRAVDASLLILESIAHILPMDCIFNTLLEYRSAAASVTSSREFVPPPVMSPPTICSLVMVLLQPQDHFVSPTHLQRLAALLLNTAHSAGGSLLIRSYVLPQLLPLLNCSPARRITYNPPSNSSAPLTSHNSDYDPNSPLRRDTWTRQDSRSKTIDPPTVRSSTNSIMLVDDGEGGDTINADNDVTAYRPEVGRLSAPSSPVGTGGREEAGLETAASCPPTISGQQEEEDAEIVSTGRTSGIGNLDQGVGRDERDLQMNSAQMNSTQMATEDIGRLSDVEESGVGLGTDNTSSDCEDEAGWLELCQVVYPMLADSVGLTELRSQVPGWRDLENQLVKRFGWQPAVLGSSTGGDSNVKPDAMQASIGAAVRERDKESSGTILAGLRGRLSDLVNKAAPIPFFAQQQVLVESTFRFMEGIGWSAPSAPAVFPGSPIADKGGRRANNDVQAGGKAGGASKMSLIQKLTLGSSTGRAGADGGERGEQELVSMSSQPLSPPGHSQQIADPLSPTAVPSSTEALTSRSSAKDSGADSIGQQQNALTSPATSGTAGDLKWTGNNLRNSCSGSLSTSGRDWQWLPPEQPQPRTGRIRFPWRRVPPGTMWWPQVWNLQASALHAFTAHRGGMCALTVDPGEQWVLTAGRGPANNIPDAHVVRCWAIGDCHTEAQYTAHQAHIVSMCLLTQQPNIVASLDQLGYIHVWGRENAKQLSLFAPVIGAEAGMNSGSPLLDARVPLNHLNEVLYPQGVLLALEQRGRGWQALGGLPTGKQMAEAPDAGQQSAPGAGSVSSPTSPLVRLGYTTLCPSFQRHNMLLAGSADARLCCLDVETGNIHSEMLARPSLKIDATLFISATCGNEAGWVAVGNTAGHVLVMDERCGTVQHAWRGHEGGINTLITPSDHTILTSGQDRDKTVRLWDIRCASSSSSVLSSPASVAPESSPNISLATSPKGRGSNPVVAGAMSWQPGPYKAAPQLLQIYAGHKDGVEGMVQYKDSVITWSGAYLGLLSLSAPFPPRIQPTKVKGLKGMREGGSIVGVGVLPFSKLLMVGTDDGTLKYCS